MKPHDRPALALGPYGTGDLSAAPPSSTGSKTIQLAFEPRLPWPTMLDQGLLSCLQEACSPMPAPLSPRPEGPSLSSDTTSPLEEANSLGAFSPMALALSPG